MLNQTPPHSTYPLNPSSCPRPVKQDAFFIDIMIKAPVTQIVSLNLGLVVLTLEYPASFMKGTAAYQSLVASCTVGFPSFLRNMVLPGAFSRRVPVVEE